MKLEIEISDSAVKWLGPDTGKMKTIVEALAEGEARRLMYIDRSRPKDGGTKVIKCKELRVRNLGEKLRNIFALRKAQLGDEEFEKILGSHFTEMEEAIARCDLGVLQRIENAAPWQKSWGHEPQSSSV